MAYAKCNVTGLTRQLGRMKSQNVTYLVFLAAKGHLEAGLEDQSVTSRSPTEAYAKVHCHVIAKTQIRGRIVLVLLAHLAERTVPLEPQRHDLADIDTCPGPWLELPLVFGTRKIMLERGIGEQLQRAKAPFEDRRQLGGTGALAERRPRRLVLGAEPDADGETPRLRRPHPRAQPPPSVLEAQSRHLGAEDVASYLPVLGNAAGELGGKAPLALGRGHCPREAARAAAGVVDMAFQLPFAAMGGGVGIDCYFEMFLT